MKYVIVGGGIAGVSCAKEMLKLDRDPSLEVVLISASSCVKSVENFRKVGQYGEKFDVKEIEHDELFVDKRFQFINDIVTGWNAQEKEIVLQKTGRLQFDKLCIATGSTPRGQKEFGGDSRFIFLRDTQSALQLKTHLENNKNENILIIGNGGIATELMYELKNVNVSWLIRNKWICASFFPEDVERFIEERLLGGRPDGKKHDGVQKHLLYTTSSSSSNGLNAPGPALGPDWCASIDFANDEKKKKKKERSVRILKNCVVEKCQTERNLIIEYMDTNDGKKKEIEADVVIWAGGVTPNSEVWTSSPALNIDKNGGISVNDACETSIPDVFACGDVCSISLPNDCSLWNQRQLWTQARQQGEICGRSMVAGAEEARMQNMYFEIFSHCTYFFGLKIVFLGDYKPERQQIGTWKVVLRDNDENQLVRCVVVDDVIVGALLIGETDMEETLENLILNKTNLGDISETFLEPGVDLDDYFD